eukprot:1156717-Pelagomonas_calceolata.AAC.3
METWVLTPAHAQQHSRTPWTLYFQMPGNPFTTSTGFHLSPHTNAMTTRPVPHKLLSLHVNSMPILYSMHTNLLGKAAQGAHTSSVVLRKDRPHRHKGPNSEPSAAWTRARI